MTDSRDEHFFRALGDAAFRHRDNPIVARQLDRLITMVKLVDLDSLEAEAKKYRDEELLGSAYTNAFSKYKGSWSNIRGVGAPITGAQGAVGITGPVGPVGAVGPAGPAVLVNSPAQMAAIYGAATGTGKSMAAAVQHLVDSNTKLGVSSRKR